MKKLNLELGRQFSLSGLADRLRRLLESRIWAKILVGLLLGVIVGICLSAEGPLADFVNAHQGLINGIIDWAGAPAAIFLKLIQMVIIPLIVASIVCGIGSAETPERMKTVGIRFATYVTLVTISSAFIGYALTEWMEPGRHLRLDLPGDRINQSSGSLLPRFNPSLIADILPINPLASIVQGQMLEVVIIAIIGGIAFLTLAKEQSEPVLRLLTSVQSLCMTVIAWAMKIAPYAVFGLMLQVAAKTGFNSLISMGRYVLTTYCGYLIILSCFFLIVWVLRGVKPIVFLRYLASPLLMAISTSSSAATMPLTLQVAENEMKLDKATVRYLVPLGTAINMAGTAVWQSIAVTFISQIYGLELSNSELMFVIATSVGSALGAPGVPGVGIGILATVLTKLGLPVEAISLVVGVDRLVDMGCTAVNVAGDLTACQIFASSEEANSAS